MKINLFKWVADGSKCINLIDNDLSIQVYEHLIKSKGKFILNGILNQSIVFDTANYELHLTNTEFYNINLKYLIELDLNTIILCNTNEGTDDEN